MADYRENTNQVLQSWTQMLYDTNKAIVQTAIAAQERNVRFAQQVYEGGIDVLKSHIEATRHLLQEQPQSQQEAIQTALQATLETQERNIRYAQDVFAKGTEVLKDHVDAVHNLTQSVTERAQEQQDVFSSFAHSNA